MTTADDGTTSRETHLCRATELRDWLDGTGAEHLDNEASKHRTPMGSDLGQQMYDWTATVH